jgi:hypothetical protein
MLNNINKKNLCNSFFKFIFILKIFESLDEKDETDATTWMRRIMK